MAFSSDTKCAAFTAVFGEKIVKAVIVGKLGVKIWRIWRSMYSG